MYIKINDFTKKINNEILFKDVNIEIEQGNIITILGASGSGKSTLLKNLIGLDNDYTGEFYINNELQNGIKAGKRPISLMFQEPILFPHLSVIENVEFSLKCKKVNKNKRVQLSKDILCEFGLEKFLDKNIFSLSGGEKQRVSLARALVTSPKLLLLDEPFSKLDLQLSKSIITFVKDVIKSHNITSILVTHNYEEAKMISNDFYVYKNKNIIKDTNYLVDEFFEDGVFFESKFVPMEKLILNNESGIPVKIKSIVKIHGVKFTSFIVDNKSEKLILSDKTHENLQKNWYIKER